MEGARKGNRRRWLFVGGVSLIGAAILGIGFSYLFLVVRDQPLIHGSWGRVYPAQHVEGSYPGADAEVVDYVDASTIAVELSVRNDGRFGLTVTGVPTDPAWNASLSRIDAARSAVMQGPEPCCIVDSARTWAAQSFRPFHLGPGQEGTVVLRLVLGHCHDNSVGAIDLRQSVRVDYDVLGYHHEAEIPLITPVVVRYTATDICP